MPVKGYQLGLYYSANDSDYATETAGANGWTELTNVDQVTPPTATATDIDDTHYKSANEHDEFSPGFANAGEVTLRKHFDSANYGTTLLTLFRVKKGWRLLYQDTTSNGVTGTHAGGVGFDGYIKSIGQPQIDRNGNVYVDITIKNSGALIPILAQA